MRFLHLLLLIFAVTTLAQAGEEKAAWWNVKWPVRKKITIDTTDKGSAITAPVGTAPLLIRLHDGDFNFLAAKEDGSDLRFVAEDGKTVLKHHIERWDSLLNEAYVWVQVPEVGPSALKTFWMYYGNVTDAVKAEDAKGTYDTDTVTVYHFGEAASVAADSSASGISLQNTSPPLNGALAGGGLRLLGQAAVTIPEAPSMVWAAGSALTWSAWIRPAAAQANAIIFSRRDGANEFLIGIDNGVPFAAINKQRSSGGAPVAPTVWQHLAVVTGGGTVTVYLNGTAYGTLAATLPALAGSALIGKDSAPGSTGFVGELDELEISKTERGAGYLQFAARSQGTGSEAAKLIVMGADEASEAHEGGEFAKQLTLIKDISSSLTFDGWVVIVLCAVLAVVGWGVAIAKLLYLNKIGRATAAFLQRWEKVSSDLTAIDHGDAESIKTMGGNISGKAQRLMRHSPLYHIYHLGSEEIRQRHEGAREGAKGLSSRSITAIKASLHGGLVREVQRLNSKLVFLTIGIAGGPYLGLLGTVIGVMITFAVIAKSGQVEVNSIAPGIAGALLATVAGLAVAIPALFAYSYLSSRIKDAVSNMETFIDEFIAKMAEAYPESRS
ncbi:MAG: biopolymer transporter ExbB [Verrucomicrobiaceae bacterium]|nr:biopolymer transporter ExbB [Verrucomicrobiaceae bacterium]